MLLFICWFGFLFQDTAEESLLDYGKRAAEVLHQTSIEDLEQAKLELEAMRSNVKFGEGGGGQFIRRDGKLVFQVRDRQWQRKKIEEWQEKIRELQTACDNFRGWKLTRLPMPPAVNGSIGLSWGRDIDPGKTWCNVVQITGPLEAIVTIYGDTCIIRGVSTDDLTDNSGFSLPADTPVRISKTTYPTTIGGTKTVFVIQTFKQEYDAFLNSNEYRDIPVRPAVSTRDWKSKDGTLNEKAVCIGVEKNIVTLRRQDGSKLEVKLFDLSPEDQKFVQKWKNP